MELKPGLLVGGAAGHCTNRCPGCRGGTKWGAWCLGWCCAGVEVLCGGRALGERGPGVGLESLVGECGVGGGGCGVGMGPTVLGRFGMGTGCSVLCEGEC